MRLLLISSQEKTRRLFSDDNERIELAKAYVQVIPTTEGIKDKLSDSFTKEGQDSGNKFTLGMTSVLKGAAKGIGVAAGAIAVAVGKVVKDATSAYADFEQLSGGIETLFGAGGRSLEEYAAKGIIYVRI